MTQDVTANDIAEPSQPIEPVDAQKALERAVARAMWRLDIDPQMSVEDKKVHWAESRANHFVRARKLLRFLENEKFAVVALPGT